MPDANYAVSGTSRVATNTGKIILSSDPTASSVNIFNDIASNQTGQDSSIIAVAIFR
jgi:hypothetical protein